MNVVVWPAPPLPPANGPPPPPGAIGWTSRSESRTRKKALGEPGRVEQRVVDPHGVRVGETRMGIRGTLGRRMLDVRVEPTDRIPIHTRPPECMAREVGVASVAEHP